MADVLASADRAFVEEDYDGALELYTEALAQVKEGQASIYDSRAQVHIKLEQYMEAVEDANKALELEPGMAKAYLRKGIASFMLEEYEAALVSFQAGSRLAPDNKQFSTWMRKCQAELEDELGSARINSTPNKQAHTEAPPTKSSPTSVLPPVNTQPAASNPAAAAPAVQPDTSKQDVPLAPAATATSTGKYRHQYYQMQNKVTVDVYAKNLAKEQVRVEFGEQHLLIVITEPGTGAEEFKLDVDLYGKVVPEQCRYEVLRSKVEVTMTKKDNLAWAGLEPTTKAVASSSYSNPQMPPVAGQYPSSYKKPKDWSKIESEVKELEQKGELQDGDPLNDFFKKIFKDGDEDQRRAMMKSFVESNGTVLSTNWKEVGQKKVECSPPDGMKVNKWEH